MLDKKIISEAAMETHERISQLEKDNAFLRCAVQKTQSEITEFRAHVNLNLQTIDYNFKELEKRIEHLEKFQKPTAITAAPKAPRKRGKPKRSGHARKR